ncbi:hypothetical protein ACFQZX_07960 [Mucilaginibacter litoreus]|uniref:Lipocalin-like domain-containing protein n=1 Tax=Mucilaginibacter litoreus TaxID=1048221 RepID=A0ABW3ARS5_9SPHI
MNNNYNRFLGIILLLTAVALNSCKKEKQDYLSDLLIKDQWQLGSVLEYHYLGDSQLSVDTIQCDATQIFKFNKDKTCAYTNFGCNAGTISGNWSISGNRLYLISDLTVPDATASGTSQPFINARINNLGDFSLVLETGDIQTYYTATDYRDIRRYGFVRVRTVSAE